MKITKRRLIFKISTSRLKKAKWNLTLSLEEAKNNNEVIALGDSQMIRWIDEMNNAGDVGAEISRIKREIRAISKQENSVQNRHTVRALHKELDRIQFLPDYIHIIADNNSDYVRATKGFKINGIKFARLLGTNGGLKNSTVVFVNEKLVEELRRRVDNGRDKETKLVPGKFEAYRALCCSGSIPVSMPHGIIVVDDCVTHFREDVIMLNDEGRDEPLMTIEEGYEVELDESDGYGLMSPELAARWSQELGLGYTSSGFCLRYAYTKGMVFPFDFHEFAEKIAGKYEIPDAWGDMRDVRNAELILTTSQLKLWNSYPNMEAYLAHCAENHYSFAVTKAAPEVLEHRRSTNYQFLQGFDLSDDQIEELIAPTMKEFKDVLSGDYRKAILFACGTGINDKNIHSYMFGYGGALIAEPEMFKDPYIKRMLYNLIRHRIDEAKIGVLRVHGNYSIIGGDPYALCQSMFGMDVTGLLNAGEIWNEYWVDAGVPDVIACRAPMSAINNIRKRHIANGEDVRYWFRFIHTCTLLNAWDTCRAAENGADCDGDLFFLTDNPVMLNNLPDTKTIYCVQRNATKVTPDEDTLIKSNLASFGDDIGKTTNKVTAMYDVQAMFDPDSEEYKTLAYRIMSGQLYQQNCIDKIKGIVCNPMPRSWYDYHANALPDNATDEQIAAREFNLRILADKKPYFMRYIYPTLMKQYNAYIKNSNTKCLREFRMDLKELLAIAPEDLTPEQDSFVSYYRRRMPVGDNDCVMNRICRRFEEEFDGRIKAFCEEPFDYAVMRSDAEYTPAQFANIKRQYDNYNAWLKELSRQRRENNISDEERRGMLIPMSKLRTDCLDICSSMQVLCNIVLDMCYKRATTKKFAWDLCGQEIIHNLAEHHNGVVSYPAYDPDGDIEFAGMRFSMKQTEMSDDIQEDDAFEGDRSERDGMGEGSD